MTFPEDRPMFVPLDFVCARRERVVDSDLDLIVDLKLFDLRQTSSISILVERHWTLNRDEHSSSPSGA